MSTIPASNDQNIRYVMQVPTEKEEKNFLEGVIWGLNGIHNIAGAVFVLGGTLTMDTAAIGVATVVDPGTALVGAVGLAAANVFAYYLIKAELSIAGKSFTHMSNTIL